MIAERNDGCGIVIRCLPPVIVARRTVGVRSAFFLLSSSDDGGGSCGNRGAISKDLWARPHSRARPTWANALDDLIRALLDERGLAAATLLGLRRSLTPFLAWLAAGGRAWQDGALKDVTAYLASRPTGAA